MDKLTIACKGLSLRLSHLGEAATDVYKASVEIKQWEKANSSALVLAKGPKGWTQKVHLSKAVKEGWHIVAYVR